MGVMEALLEVLSRGLRPTVLVLEDTHWADEATLDVIRYVGRRIARTNGLLLLTYRDGEVDFDHPLRQVIGELQPGDLERLNLQPLSKPGIASMIDVTELDVEEVFELTAGNPLFVHELLVSAPGQIPFSVQDSVLARASKLSPGAKALLELVAVVPGETEQPILEGILDPSPAELAECIRQGLLDAEKTSVSFRHELARRAVESALDPATRQRLNKQVLVEIGANGNPSRLVHHALEAGDVPSIVEFAPLAAASALDVGSLSEALAHFRNLQPYLDQLSEIDRARIVDDWARSEFYADNEGSLDILEQAIELHRSTGDDYALARALTFAVRVNEVTGRPEAAEGCAFEALTILENKPLGADLAFALSQRGWLAMMRSDDVVALEYADRAMEMAREVGDELTTVHSLNTKGTIRYTNGHPDGLTLFEEARSRAEAGRYRFEEIRALINMTAAALERMEIELAGEFAQRAMATAVRYEIGIWEAFGRTQYSEVLLRKGDWATAEDLATQTPSLPMAELYAGWVLGRIQTRKGRAGARDTLARSWSLAEASGELQNLVPSAAAMAEYIWLTGDDVQGLMGRLDEVLNKAIAQGQVSARGDLAWWLWEIGNLPSVPDGIPGPYARAMGGEARAAADEWGRLGYPYERAMVLTHADKTGRLEALEILETLGATAVAAKVRQSVRADGITVPRGRARTTRSHGAGLTARQAEVLQLLDGGLSNSEIADRLFVSPRTVEHHVSAVLTKLDSSTRDEAVSRARADGLVSS